MTWGTRGRRRWRRRTLTSLDLGSNGVGDAGGTALAAALCTEACKLTSLDLFNNDMGDAGATALAAALRTEACEPQPRRQ